MFALYQKLQTEILSTLDSVARPHVIEPFTSGPLHVGPRPEYKWRVSDGYFSIRGEQVTVYLAPNGHASTATRVPLDMSEVADLVAYCNACEAALGLMNDVVLVGRQDVDYIIRQGLYPCAASDEVLGRLMKVRDSV